MARQLVFKGNIAEYRGKFYYRATVRGETRQKVAYGATSRKDADRMRKEEQRKMELEQAGLLKPSTPVPLAKLCQLKDTHAKMNNRSKPRPAYREGMQEYWGLKKDARKLKRGDIEKWRIWLKEEKNLSNSTINKYCSYLNMAYELAMKDGLLESNPLNFISKLEEPKENIKFLTKEEMHKVLNTLEDIPKFKNLVLVVAMTGFRISNVNYMRWEWVDTEHRLIHIPPKDNKGGVDIVHEISDDLFKIFEEIGVKSTGYVFPLGEGGLTPFKNPARDTINKVFKKAGIKANGFHILRHTVGTILAENGIPFKSIQAFLHHKDARTPLKYIHQVENNQAKADNAIKNFISS